MNDREALIILNMISGIGSARVEALSVRFGSPSAILEASMDELESISGIGSALAERISSWHRTVDVEKEMRLAEMGGAEIITRFDPGYPGILKEIYDSPLCLYVRGTLPDLEQQSLAIVGSRRISNYGRKTARHFSESAVYAGWTVISGLAYGVDMVAHQACLDAGGKTVAVLGGGLARIHPQEHIPLARDIIESGAVISEFPMEFPANRQSFPRRNRIISGLSRAVLIIEAGLKSGALITANSAIDQNRALFAVPGHIDQPQAQGCNKLIKDSCAKLTDSFEDILSEFEYLPGFRPESKTVDDSDAEVEIKTGSSDLSEDEQKIFSVLSDGEANSESLSQKTGLPAGKLLSLLMKMEMSRHIHQHPGKVYSIRK